MVAILGTLGVRSGGGPPTGAQRHSALSSIYRLSRGGHRPSVLEQSSEVLRPLLFELGLLFTCDKSDKSVTASSESAARRVDL